MGAVYKAQDPTLDRGVALKILPIDLVSNQDRLDRFVQEAKSASGLNHPNVVTIYEIGRDELEVDGKRHPIHFIAMELIEGKTLRALLRSGEADLRRSLKILAEVADGLGVAHEAGIVHRDVKPENIMVGASGHAKILDFGLAKLKGGSTGDSTEESVTAVKATDPGMIMGTVGYMSPEQAQGKDVDRRSDVFTLGCILYEVATGRQPFAGDSRIDTLHKIIYEKPEPLESIMPSAPLALQWILRKALAKDPNDRYQTIRDLAIDLRSLIQDIDSNPSLVSVSGRIDSLQAPRVWRPGPGLIAVAAFLIVALVASVWFLTRKSPAPTEQASSPLNISSRMVTSSGRVTGAAISPDGKYVAYIESWQGEQSLWIRHLTDPQSLELVEAAPVAYWGLAFTKSGDAIIYGAKSNDDLDGAFYRISTLGGTPTRLVDKIDSAPTFSPDGRRMAWLRARYPTGDESAVMVGNVDGTDERVLATRSKPEQFAPIFWVKPSWSSDGRRIASAVMNINEVASSILILDAETGEVERKLDAGWPWVGAVEWLPDGSGLFAIADEASVSSGPDVRPQVWFVPYPEGTPRRLTNDFFHYRIVSLTEDGNSLITVGSDAVCDIFTTSSGPDGDLKKVSSSLLDGYYGASFTSDGRIVYQGLANGRLDIWIMNQDGSGRRQLTNDDSEARLPRSKGDGTVYLSIGTSGVQVRWVALDGGPSRLITATNILGAPTLSPDGKWVIFGKRADGVDSLWKVSVAGGTPTRLTNVDSYLPDVSPDGTKIAFYYADPDSNRFRIGVIPFEGGERIVDFEAYVPNNGSNLRWTADGNALLVNSTESDRANLWLQPLDGSSPTQLTHLDDLLLRGFDYSPDGSTWLLARGKLSRDAILITGFR